METAVLPQLRSEDLILEHGDQQCNKVSVFDGPPGGGSLRWLPLSGRVGVGDRAMTRRPKPLPGDGVPQAVYALTERIQRRLMAHLQGTGLHWGLRRILQELWIQDGLSQAELAHAVRSSEASASNMLKHLVRGGWVERRRDPYDYRISRVYLTEQGRSLRATVEKECASIHEEICQELGANDAKRLAALLGKALDRLMPVEGEDEETTATGIYDSPSPPGEL